MSEARERTTSLSPERRALLALQLKKKAAAYNSFQLSFAQERLWFLDQFEPNSPSYNIPLAVTLKGDLKLKQLERSFNEMIWRHESLRTTFPVANDLPVQAIAAPEPISLPLIDLSELPEPRRNDEAQRVASEDTFQPFNLAKDSLLRVKVLRIDREEHVLILTMHHIISDGWSLGVLIREMTTLYRAFIAGEPSPLEDLPIQYADYSTWQRQWLQGEVFDQQMSYWKQQLSSAPVMLQLPTDRPRPASKSNKGRSAELSLSRELSKRVINLSQHEGTTLFMCLLAAFKVLLYRYTGQTDISVGSPIANRTRREIEGLIGFFVNTLVLRSDLSGEPSFRDVLRREREVALGAYAHQDVPFEKLVEELQPERSLSYTPLFQVMFSVQNASGEHVEIPGLTVGPFTLESRTAKFDLTFTLMEQAGVISGSLDYDSELFDGETISRMLRHYERLLYSMVEDPDVEISRLRMITDRELEDVAARNDTEADFAEPKCLHQLFREQMLRVPEAPAVSLKGEPVSYRELDRRSNQLGHYLRTMGVGPESRVGICLQRSAEMMVAILGILKAGGAYVALDPANPKQRLAFMIRDGQIGLVLTNQRLLEALPEQEVPVVCLDAEGEAIIGFSDDEVVSGVRPENLAYVLYTSGSTGRPKGVMVSHRAIFNRLLWAQSVYNLTEKDRVLQSASFGFDFSVWEIFGALMAGAELVLLEPDKYQDLSHHVSVIAEANVTIVHYTPSALRVLLEQDGLEACDSLRLVFSGGEPLSVDLCERFFDRLSSELYNQYGPTEASVDVTYWRCRRGGKGRSVPIGRPIANTKIYLLDKHLHPVPTGVLGELAIGGVGLARGYFGRADLTADAFIPDPFSSQPGERLYKTGDLARYLPDESIDFAGRIDNQVKVRGFRIELGEIETVLEGQPNVREAVVLAREDAPGEKRLVGYVVGDPERLPTTSELQDYLRNRLPAYMIPSAFLLLEALPLMSNGKVDRAALPGPDRSRPELEQVFVGPRTPTEELLTGIWARVLERELVGVHDNFFELGGHSLTAMVVVSRIRDALKFELPVRGMFEAPTIAALAERVEAGLRGGQGDQIPPIRRVGEAQRLELSYAQRRLWFLDQLEPGNSAYNIPTEIRLEGDLDIAALQMSLSELVRRHEVLRTSFMVVDGEPLQFISEAETLPLPIVDLIGLPDQQREQESRRVSTREAQTGFDLSRGPLVRAMLVRLGEQEHAAVVNLHHIVSDVWSTGIMIREVTALYHAYRAGEASPLEELEVQYADYAMWQREWLQGEVLEEQLEYWKQQLGNAPKVLELAMDHPRPALRSYKGATESLMLSEELTKQLKQLGRREGATLFMTLLAAFKVLLYRYTGQTDISVGSPIANRRRREIEGLIGFFVNTLVLRSDLSGEPSFREVLKREREVALGAYAHQDVPFEKLVEELQPERSLSYTPLFQVMFLLQNAGGEVLELPGLELTSVEVERGTSKFDLTAGFAEQGGRLVGGIEYDSELFDGETIRRMLGHYERLLESIVAEPDKEIAALEMMSAEERRQVLVEWNDTAADRGEARLLHELFERQAELNPEAVAVVYEDESISYADLNKRANQLAHRLIKQGAGPETVIGVCLSRSIELVVALLGVLKSGAAYLPLDESYPRERLRYILENSGADIILTSDERKDVQADSRARLILINDGWQEMSLGSNSNPEVRVSPESLAYVIYTSGSTGEPKGVMITHRAIVNHMRWMDARFPLSPEDAVLQKTSLSFDASVWEFYAPLMSGARLVMAREGMQIDSKYLVREMARQGVSTLQVVPSMLRMILGEQELENCARLRRVYCGGEVLDKELMERFYERIRAAELVNLYGPTEASIDATYRECEEDWAKGVVTIGRPIANTSIYILDKRKGVAPVGVTGEIYIAGDGLARGYLGRPDLTAEKFIPNPFSAYPGERLYKTGDRGRYNADGSIRFQGRDDNQVKIRGFRIELGEIETVLEGHPNVREAVVLAREDAPGEKRLVGYVVGDPERLPTTSELQDYLRNRLPAYMVPSTFLLLEALPLMSNGKMDRAALPAPDPSRLELNQVFVAARTPTEELLSGIWAAVLEIEQVGVHDNFFELGGHSLTATVVVSRIREAFKLELPVRGMFEAPTIASLAERVEAGLSAGQGDQISLIRRVDEVQRLELSYAQRRLWFLDQLEPGNSAYNIPTEIRLKGDLDIAALQMSLSELVRRHEVLRTSFTVIDGEPLQIINEAEMAPLPIVDLVELPEQQREQEGRRVSTQEATTGFDLSSGPLIRAMLVRLGEDDHAAVVTVHHIASDVWSTGIMIREVTALYHAYRAGEASPLEELEVQYADYAMWQREWLQGEVLEEQLAYWRGQLGESRQVLELPTDRPRPAVQSYRGATASLALSEELTKQLKQLGRREGATLFMTLLGAFKVLLYRYTGQTDISVGSPIANRRRREIEGLIGFFVNTLVLRSDLSGEPSFREVLKREREVALGAYAHQDVPFEKLVEELQPERSLSYTPLFQVMFLLQNAGGEVLELPGLELTSVEVERGTSKFDLTAGFAEQGGRLVGGIEYDSELFDGETIRRMLGHYERLLESIVAEPDKEIAALEMMSAEERRQVLEEWNETAEEYPSEVALRDLFREQVEQTPEAVAVVYEGETISYRELDERAEALARRLKAKGAGPEKLIGVCLERGIDLVVALLGILKSGAAYLPLDASYPKQRLAYMLKDSGAGIVITQRELEEAIGESDVEKVLMDEKDEEVEEKAAATMEVRGENLAYVMYTSGSTGEPKGVMITQRNVARLVKQERYARMSREEVYLQMAPVSFDASTFEIWGCLLNGGKLVVMRAGRPSLRDIEEVIRAEEVTTLWLTAGLFRVMVEERVEGLRGLKQLLAGGDVLQAREVRRVLRECEGVEVINGYGPTESTTFATSERMRSEEEVGEKVAIGRPIANTRVYILGKRQEVAPAGVKGEIYIGGDGLGRGYIGRAELTAEKFVPDPYRERGGERMYRTGDVGRYGRDGRIEFLGRVDDQVKVRGYRVEPGEIEAVLKEREEVSDAVVVVRGEEEGEKRLVGYVVMREGEEWREEELREYMSERLPDYMVPAAIVMLEALPLTENGKVDRSALPDPRMSKELERVFVAPRTPFEETVADIWSAVLNVDKVGITDNFFELGGHSLNATVIVSRLRAAFNVELSVRSLFEAPTVADLSVSIVFALVEQKDGAEILAGFEAPSEFQERAALAVAEDNNEN